MKLLLAEDDEKLAKHILRGLTESSYAVDIAKDGVEAMWLGENYEYDLMILDVMLPGKDGISLVRHFRSKGKLAPILILTARSGIEDRVQGLDAGADDYLGKPFSMMEFLARVRALLRRQTHQTGNVLQVDDLILDQMAHQAKRGDRVIDLTSREFSLLRLLMTSSPHPVSKTTNIEKVWDQHFDSGTNLVNVYMNHLRKKIDPPHHVPLIHTVRGVGFVLKRKLPA